MALLPRVIYSAWLQGAAQAPAIVQLCFQRWARLNPEYQLRVLVASDAAAVLAPHNLPPVPPQALTDILRAKLLLEHGGIWVDASLYPVAPLSAWLPGLMNNTEVFAFARPGPDRPISSWFMAASPGSLIMRRLWVEILRFWHKPRQLAQYNGGVIPPNPAASVAPEAGGASNEYPYFWLHYLFQYLLETDTNFAAAWSLCPHVPAIAPHQLQAACAAPATAQSIITAARTAPVQKLNWRAPYPLDLLALL
jgi:hypothetical protein